MGDTDEVTRYHQGMGVSFNFEEFAAEVRNHLWVLEVEPAFTMNSDAARFMWQQYVAELEPLGVDAVRLLLSSQGQLIRTIDLPMNDRCAKIAADGIIAVFEPDS